MFGFDPEQMRTRLTESGDAKFPTRKFSLLYGTIGFCLISLLVFGIWAFAGRLLTQSIGEGGFYAVCAVAFIGLSGFLFNRLLIGEKTLLRFCILFAIAFIAYSALWCLAWFMLRAPMPKMPILTPARIAGLIGALLGVIAMNAVLCAGFRNWRPFVKATLILFISNAAGYFLGDAVFTWLLFSENAASLQITSGTRALLAMLGWGFFYGLGFGYGISDTLYRLQAPVREGFTGSSSNPSTTSE